MFRINVHLYYYFMAKYFCYIVYSTRYTNGFPFDWSLGCFCHATLTLFL